jgi:branched-chain amino acid transport system ATP-binding protein
MTDRPTEDIEADFGDDVISADQVAIESARIAGDGPTAARLAELAGAKPLLTIENLRAGYGKMEILHGIDLQICAGQSLCLIGPNGAGKSTVLHSIYGFTNILSGTICVNSEDITRLTANQKLKSAGIAYVLQDNSVFPDMTVEENLWLGGFLMAHREQAKQTAERVFQKYSPLAERRKQPARVLSGGERRLLEIARALIMEPRILLIDEPSIGLEPRYIDMVFEILADLQRNEGKTIIMVEQNAKKGLEFSDIAYLLISGSVAMADAGQALLKHPDIGRLFLGD